MSRPAKLLIVVVLLAILLSMASVCLAGLTRVTYKPAHWSGLVRKYDAAGEPAGWKWGGGIREAGEGVELFVRFDEHFARLAAVVGSDDPRRFRQGHGRLDPPDVDLLAHQELPEIPFRSAVDGLYIAQSDFTQGPHPTFLPPNQRSSDPWNPELSRRPTRGAARPKALVRSSSGPV